MAMRHFCDKCDRDITNHDRFHIAFYGCTNDTSVMGRYETIDLCAQCARTFDANKMLEQRA